MSTRRISAAMQEERKQYFFDMVDTVRQKLDSLPAESCLRKHFPDSRIDEITKKIKENSSKDLEWGYWQPFFLFLERADNSAIQSLDYDLQAVAARSSSSATKLCEFLDDEREFKTSWSAGLFEVFTKAAFLRSKKFFVESFNWSMSNGRNIDAKLKIGQRAFCVECTTLGDSDADKARWRAHCERLKKEPDATYCESQDAYTQGRRLYDKVYEKVAKGFDLNKSQLSPDSPNLLLIGFFSVSFDLAPTTASVGWALDELFNSQPTGNRSTVSLYEYLRHNLNGRNDSLNELLAAPRMLSGILLFNRYKLDHARINYNADKKYRISHAEMALFEEIFERSPSYCC